MEEDEKVKNNENIETTVQETQEKEESSEPQAEVKEDNGLELKLQQAEEKIANYEEEIKNNKTSICEVQQQKINLEKEVQHVSSNRHPVTTILPQLYF